MSANYHTDIVAGAAANAVTFNNPLGELDAAITIALSALVGWTADSVTWTYASAATFTITGDATTRFPAGSKIKLTQTTVKYFYVVSATYSSPNTTVTVTGGSDYSLANASITLPAYSYAATPQGFPQWFNWTPTITGFSANPPMVCRFNIIERRCSLVVFASNVGTSNATTFTISIPVAASATPATWASLLSQTWDNGALQASPGYGVITQGGSAITLYKTVANGVWTNTGAKAASFSLDYEI